MNTSKQSKNGTPIKKQVHWDEASALNRMGGEINSLLVLIKLFITDMASQLDVLQQAFKQNDLVAARQAAHTIKGTAANLSALKLQTLAAQLEGDIIFLLEEPSAQGKESSAQGKEPLAHGKEPLTQKLSELIIANKQVMRILTQYQSEHSLNHEPESSPQQLTHRQLKTMLQSLLKKTQQGDYIEPQELDKLRADIYDESLQTMVNRLLEQLGQFDANGAVQSVNDILLKMEFEAVDEGQNGY